VKTVLQSKASLITAGNEMRSWFRLISDLDP